MASAVITTIVDDSDASIVYGGSGWTSGALTGPQTFEYNGTQHSTGDNGAWIAYTFNGVGIAVFGTVDAPSTKGMATSTYTIDGQTQLSQNLTLTSDSIIAGILDLQSHLLFYRSSRLADGQHTLNVTLSNITNSTPKFYFDFFTVDLDPSSATASANTQNMIVNDQDPRVQYVGNWTVSHAFNDYLGDDHAAPESSSSNATFSFVGTSITVYGAIPGNNYPGTKIDFYLDSEPVNHFASDVIEAFRRHVPIYTKSGLPQANHTIVVSSTGSKPFWLDYFIYSPTASSSSSSSPAVGNGSASSANASPPAGAIAGGVVGGVVLLALLAVLIFFLRRRSKQQRQKLAPEAVPSTLLRNPPSSPPPEKKPLSPHTATTTTVPVSGTASSFLELSTVTALAATTPTASTVPPRTPSGTSASPVGWDRTRTLTPTAAAVSKEEEASASSASPRPVTQSTATASSPPIREEDGGVRLASGDSDDEPDVPNILPPLYARY